MAVAVQIIAPLQTRVPATMIINGGGCDIRGVIRFFPVIILGIRELDDQSEHGERRRPSHAHDPRPAIAAIRHDMIHGLLFSTRISSFQTEQGEKYGMTKC